MPIIRIPSPLRSYTEGEGLIPVSGVTVSEAMQDLVSQYPSLKKHLYNKSGELRSFVNLFVGEASIRDLQGLDTPLNDKDSVLLLPSIAGGSISSRKDP